MDRKVITLDQAIDTVKQLPEEQQEILIDIFYRRQLEKCRKEIAKDAKKSIADFHAGKHPGRNPLTFSGMDT